MREVPPTIPLPGAFNTELVRASRLGGHVRSSTLLFARARHVVRVESHAAIAPTGAAPDVARLAARQRAILPAVLASTAREQSRRLGGSPILVEPMEFKPGLILAPVATIFLLVILPWRYLRDAGRRRRYRIQVGDPRWSDITHQARRTRWARRWRASWRVLAVAFAAAIVLTGIRIGGVICLLLAAALGWLITPPSARRWAPRRPRRPSLRSPRSLTVPVFGILVLALAGCSLALIAGALFLNASGIADAPMFVDGVYDIRYLWLTPSWSQRQIGGTLLVGRVDDLAVVLFLMGLGVLALAVIVQRFGRRLAAASAESAQERDRRPPVVYLRSFGDDRLRLSSSALNRAALVERVTPIARQPLEEVLARQLSLVGPVIALASTGTRLPKLGAAKRALGVDEWQEQISNWIKLARLVAVSATPVKARENFLWEIEELDRVRDAPVILILGPLSRRDVEDQWRRFVGAVRTLRRFEQLPDDLANGTIVVVVAGNGEWRAWGANRRNEWTYGEALHQACAYALCEADAPAGPAAAPKLRWCSPLVLRGVRREPAGG
jgi:hypothetical protein